MTVQIWYLSQLLRRYYLTDMHIHRILVAMYWYSIPVYISISKNWQNI